jgi:hypothetical protein
VKGASQRGGLARTTNPNSGARVRVPGTSIGVRRRREVEFKISREEEDKKFNQI